MLDDIKPLEFVRRITIEEWKNNFHSEFVLRVEPDGLESSPMRLDECIGTAALVIANGSRPPVYVRPRVRSEEEAK